jgi:mRNA interferase HigB
MNSCCLMTSNYIYYTCSQKENFSLSWKYNLMRVNLVKEQTVRNFAQIHATSVKSFEKWIFTVKNADWNLPEDIKKTFNSADILGRNSHRVVFDVGGNKFRIICKISFGSNTVFLFVSWIGTHAHYTSLCGKGEQFEAENFLNYT